MTEQETTQFGIHYMLDGYGAPKQVLGNIEHLRQVLQSLPGELGMHAISDATVVEVGPKNKKDSGGISGFILIAESHISFHTFPKRGFVTIDVYTCQDILDTDTLTKKFVRIFELKTYDEHKPIKRGIKFPLNDT